MRMRFCRFCMSVNGLTGMRRRRTKVWGLAGVAFRLDFLAPLATGSGMIVGLERMSSLEKCATCVLNMSLMSPRFERAKGSVLPAVPCGSQIGVGNAPIPTPTASSASGMSSSTLQRVVTASRASADIVVRALTALHDSS